MEEHGGIDPKVQRELSRGTDTGDFEYYEQV